MKTMHWIRKLSGKMTDKKLSQGVIAYVLKCIQIKARVTTLNYLEIIHNHKTKIHTYRFLFNCSM